MSETLTRIIRKSAISIKERTVIIELICSDVYGANVVYDDVLESITSDRGLTLKLRGKRA
jgi:hypothetical protein